METPPPPSSPYRVGNWTITQLKEELKQRNLSPAGRKQELIERLERFELGNQTTPRRRRAQSPDRYQIRLYYQLFILVDRLAEHVAGVFLGKGLANRLLERLSVDRVVLGRFPSPNGFTLPFV